MEYGEIIGEVVGNALCFAWQDNNIVLVATSSHSIHKDSDFITVTRKRPGNSSTNATIARFAFKRQLTAELLIPVAIDDCNHGMNAVDLANQLRANYSLFKKSLREFSKYFTAHKTIQISDLFLNIRSGASLDEIRLHISEIWGSVSSPGGKNQEQQR